ncbi:MAG: pectate lyase [Prevotella sp.]|nr:pectate lyase [Prevotella sp.]
MVKKIFLFAVMALFSTVTAFAQDTKHAFPGAEGFGRDATGGRGGTVIHVTNLNDSGEGSLREAVSTANTKTIVFDVGGVIDLESDLKILGNTTIAGQTAPYPGITIRYYTVQIYGSNIIMRYIRVRRGNEKDVNDGADACWGRNYANIILDHCSFSWSIDECASFYDNKNFTMQWCTIAESLNNAGHEKGAHGYGGIWGGKSASFHHNLLAHHTNRSPRLNGARYGWRGSAADNYASSIEAEQVDLRNNLIYNWGQGNGAYGGMGGYHNIVNNYYKYGPATKNKYRVFECSCTGSNSDEVIPKNTYGHFYIDGNYVRDMGENYDWDGVTVDGDDSKGTIRDTIKLTEPIATGTITTHSAVNTYSKVMAYAGASLYRDACDARYMEEAETGTATYTGSVTGLEGIIDTPEDVGGYPETEAVYRPDGFDTDGDGIPDDWEIANGLDPNDETDGNLYTIDTEKGWYTNLEVYINSLVEDIMKAENEDALDAVDEYYPAYTTTGISLSKATSEVSKIEYYTIGGVKISKPANGISIRKITYSNGTTSTDKVIM